MSRLTYQGYPLLFANRYKLLSAIGGIAIGGAALTTTACNAATPATPVLTGQQLVDRAVPGQTILLPRETSGTIKIVNRNFSKPITIDISRARLSAIQIFSSSGVRIVNGTVVGPMTRDSFGIAIRNSRNVGVSNVTVTDQLVGINILRSQDIAISNNTLRRLIADGIQIGGSQRVKVYNNTCSDFFPVPKIYSDDGKLIKDGDHPDCIQAWSIRNLPPTSDVEVVGNRGYGNFQGVYFGNVIVNGVSEGGYDRVVITDNEMQIAWYHGVYVADGRGVVVQRNSVRGIPGTHDIRGKVYVQPVKPFMSVLRSVRVRYCNNKMMDFPTREGTGRC